MKLIDLIKVADEAYPDGFVARAHAGEAVGDTLAVFVARELADTYDADKDDCEQLAEAQRAMSNAAHELQMVEDACASAAAKLE